MRLKKMVMVNNNNFRELLPGILFAGPDCVTMRTEAECVHVSILPEKNAFIQIQFQLKDNGLFEKYVIHADFHHEYASLEMLGLYQLRDQETLDIQTVINHYVPHCESQQHWKGVLHDSTKALFDAKIIVHPHAQKTRAKLSNKNLLLSKEAQVQTKPVLEIYADDVKCSHGATVGCLDPHALFYLQSRGIAEKVAREMLVKAFCEMGDQWSVIGGQQ